MNNLIITVSPDSSLELLRRYADIVVLDKEPAPTLTKIYDTVYIRSHFSQPSTLPQVFRKEITSLVQQARRLNAKVMFIDTMDTVDAIVDFEDKWRQHEVFGEYMPRTELFDDNVDTSGFIRPLFKHRLSSRGKGVTWDKEKASSSSGNWIIQESLNIQEELRIYVVCGEVCPVGVIRQNKTLQQPVRVVDSRELTKEEIDFSLNVIRQFASLDLVGLDVARTLDEKLSLIEVNRSPGFAKFDQLTGVDIAEIVYEKLLQKCD